MNNEARKGASALDEAWIGRRLMQASRALEQRLEDEGPRPGAPFVAPVLSPLVREIGRSLMLADADPESPLLRTRVLWRLSTTVTHRELAVGFNAMGTTVRGHLRHLPGLTPSIDRFVLNALRHSARTLLCLRHAVVENLPSKPYQERFGGLLVIADAPNCRPA